MTKWQLLQQPYIVEIFTIGTFFLASSFFLMCLEFMLKDWLRVGRRERKKGDE